MNKLVGLWKSGVKGKAVGIVCGAMVLLVLLQSGCGGSNGGNVRALFAKAKEAEKAGNINFFGFYTGMPMEDAKALAEHYGLDIEEDYSYGLAGMMDFLGMLPKRTLEENVETHEVYRMCFSLDKVRKITKRGNTFDELVKAVAHQVGKMKWDHDGYIRETIDGVIVAMNEGLGCVIVDHPRKRKAEEAAERVKEAAEKRQKEEQKVYEWFEKATKQGDTKARASLFNRNSSRLGNTFDEEAVTQGRLAG